MPRARDAFAVTSGGVRDVAGNALSGAYFGSVPTGAGRPGSRFAAVVPTDGLVAYPPQPIARTPPGRFANGLISASPASIKASRSRFAPGR